MIRSILFYSLLCPLLFLSCGSGAITIPKGTVVNQSPSGTVFVSEDKIGQKIISAYDGELNKVLMIVKDGLQTTQVVVFSGDKDASPVGSSNRRDGIFWTNY